MTGHRVSILDVADYTGETHARLEAAGCRLTLGSSAWDDASHAPTDEEIFTLCAGADAVMLASRTRLSREVLARLPALRVVSKYGIGTERIDVEAATDLGILVTNTPVPGNYHAVAEHTIAMALAVLRRLHELDDHVRSGGWRGADTLTTDLHGLVVGLLGFGRIAQQVAVRLAGWGVTLRATDPYVDPKTAAQLGVRLVERDELLRSSDVLSVHLTATADTRRLLNARAFATMKTGAVLVNTSRGEVVDSAALAAALVDGPLRGAGIDVFDPEPPSRGDPLLALSNVVASPHVAGFSARSNAEIFAAATDNVLDALAGRNPAYVRNPEVLDRWRSR